MRQSIIDLREHANKTGLRALVAESGANSSGTALEVRSSSGAATISPIDKASAKAIEEQIVFACLWAGIDRKTVQNEIKFEVDTNYLSEKFKASDFGVVMSAIDKGLLLEEEARRFVEMFSPFEVVGFDEYMSRAEEEKIQRMTDQQQQQQAVNIAM